MLVVVLISEKWDQFHIALKLIYTYMISPLTSSAKIVWLKGRKWELQKQDNEIEPSNDHDFLKS